MVETLRSVLRFETLETDPVARRLRRSVAVSDMRRIARQRVPRGVFDYVDGGAEDEHTLRANVADFARVTFRPRVLRDVGDVHPSTTLLGRPMPLPLVFSPTWFTRILCPDGELAVARAAERQGVPYTLSTLGTRSIEEVAAVDHGRKWFQVHMWRDRGLVAEMVERARAADYEALVLTVDTAVFGRRERDHRRGLTLPPRIGPGTLLDALLHPRWTWDFVRAEPIRFANVAGRAVGDGTTAVDLAAYIDRQLDTAPTPISLVAPVRDAVGDGLEVICDGGARRGSDIVKAVALGADAVGVGRASLYALVTVAGRRTSRARGALPFRGARRSSAWTPRSGGRTARSR